MSTTVSVAAVEGKTPDTKPSLSGKQHRIPDYLRSNVGVKMYSESRLIADDLNLSAKEVSAGMRPILDDDFDAAAKKWGYSSDITWKVTV